MANLEPESKDCPPEWWSAGRWARELAAGSISSLEGVDLVLKRIEERDPEVNCVVTVDAARARREARESDRRRALGEPVGRLEGVPVTIKDSFSTRGMLTTSGAPELSQHVPERDADPVARLRSAGCVIVGKTNLPIYAGDVQSFNEVFGRTNNPWDLSRSPGGSSGGSAASLAMGFSPLELGSDIAGSIRNPAHCCGVAGHKPSYGVVSARGQIPGPPGTLTQADLAVAGPMARCVSDLEMALDLLAGPDSWQATAWSINLPPSRVSQLSEVRAAVWIDDEYCQPSQEVRSLLSGAIASLQAGGARVSHEARPEIEFAYAAKVFDQLLGAALCGGYSHAEIESMAADPALKGSLGVEHATLRHRAWLSANERRLQMRRRWRAFFKDWDVVLMPVSPVPAIPHDPTLPMTARRIDIDGMSRTYTEQMRWMGLVGVAYLPVTVIPVGTTKAGLPVGIQLVGPYLEDFTALSVARLLERELGGFVPPPLSLTF